ncbi:hypothetical protein M0R88_03020 [Halorussus gelatinilyticus]|uniref:DUF7344 domain-containing protein n=1 Tax=Halorussus gelatinilyticus TaxID=2937524 RepID=A0A8U0IKC8_9EURY|nr:hypothetical protein [Halorussus gelatinilyticus]UPW01081.1 hypothetical protein M0R88_03020 [Halorussus gelatinilyticus]
MEQTSSCRAIPMDPDDAFRAISNSRRRSVILSLAQNGDVLSVSDLAVEIAAIENLIDPSDVTSKQRTRVYISLIQSHLETLDDTGAAVYDSRSKQVAPTEATDPLATHIRQISTACYKPTEESV